MAKVLWCSEGSFTTNQRRMVVRYLESEGISESSVLFVPLMSKIPNAAIKKGKQKITYNASQMEVFRKVLLTYVAKTEPTIIVINDPLMLSFILDTYVKKLMLYRGSVYQKYGKTFLVMDDILNTKAVKHAPWVYKQDTKKLARWINGQQRVQPKFRYKVCEDLNDLAACREYLDNCFLISDDIETAGGVITCIGFCGIHNDGTIFSYVVPFVNPFNDGGCHWKTEAEEVEVWKTINHIHANDAYKVFQNGSYDNAYYVAYRSPPHRYLFDTMHMFNSIWKEAPKKLWFISSIFLDYCKYWKDESKGEKKSKDKSEKIPMTPRGYMLYLRYNAQDVYNTALDCLYASLVMTNPSAKWALDNYRQELRQQLGPGFAMSMRGMRHDEDRQKHKVERWTREHEKALADIKIMADDKDYNPGSSYENASLIYDVLGAEPVKLRGKAASRLPERTTDEKILRIIASRHPLYSIVINQIWDVKKPKNLVSKYGGRLGTNGRFYYSLACTNETFRYKSSNHAFWFGTNAQNVPKKERDMFTADEGYVLWEPDYSQSDLYFVAHQCEDPDLLARVHDDKDTHCFHAAYFFKKEYERILRAHENEEDWTDHPIEGIRQITKKISHGASYQMAAYTLFIQMGREMAVATCKALGFSDAHTWKDAQIVSVLEGLLNSYFKMYKKLTEWQKESPKECAKNGNRADNGFGHTRLFFGDMLNDNAVQRELSSNYGQGGTAGNINRVLDKVYWETDLEKQGLMLLLQNHDSIVFQTPKDKMYLGKEFLTIMREPVTIKGRTFTVPVDAKVGLSWGKSMIPYRDGITYDEIAEADRKWEEKNYNGMLAL